MKPALRHCQQYLRTRPRTVAAVTTLCTVALAASGYLLAVPLLAPLMVVFGASVRMQRARPEAAQARAEFAERTREERTRRQVVEERMRIARELHDGVTHHLALANAQAGVAAALMDTEPVRARQLVA